MAESSAQDRTEEATEHKLRKSRREGQVARSRDLATGATLLVAVLALRSALPGMLDGLEQLFREVHQLPAPGHQGADDLKTLAGRAIATLVGVLLPLLVVPLLVVPLALLAGGWMFAWRNVQPQGSRLNPIKGLGRLVAWQNWTELLKSLAKMAVLAGVAWFTFALRLPEVLALQHGDTLGAITGALRLMGDTALALVAVFVVFAVLDVPLQRFFFLRKQRMTRQERKEEHKQQEGRPEVKGRIRQLQRQMAQRQITRVIDQADVVIVNPEHYAVALRYDPQRARAPYVIARGVDETALYIRQLATARGLEVLEAPPLARALYFTTQVNQQIPAPLYGAVAQVLHYILQLRAWRQGRRARPVPPQHFPIPDDLLKRG